MWRLHATRVDADQTYRIAFALPTAKVSAGLARDFPVPVLLPHSYGFDVVFTLALPGLAQRLNIVLRSRV